MEKEKYDCSKINAKELIQILQQVDGNKMIQIDMDECLRPRNLYRVTNEKDRIVLSDN